MGKGEASYKKPIRIWILGASLCAFIFLAISIKYDFWAMKTYLNTNTKHENTSYFGLWRKCLDYRPPKINGTVQIMQSWCEDFEDGDLLGIDKTPGFIQVTRGFLIAFTAVMGLATVIIAGVMFLTNKPLLLVAGVFSLVGVLMGVLVLAVFVGYINNNDRYKDYSMAWAFYYFLIGWLFTLSKFCAALTDRHGPYDA